jgi:citrate lyase subunit beta/citryl-CoA lyase
MSARVTRARSLLFVPGDRPDRFAKADASGADAVILDLEDAVAPGAKAAARANAAAWLDAGHEAIVRINAPGTGWYAEDVAMLNGRSCAVMLPKAERGGEVTELLRQIGHDSSVVPLLETARGVLDARDVCGVPGVVRVALGSVDLASQLGVDPEHGPALSMARSALVLASAEAGLPAPIDSPSLDLTVGGSLVHAQALAGLAVGLGAKLCVHPHQVPVVNQAFTPSPEEVEWALAVVAAQASGGVVRLQGQMVDKPVFERARRLLDRCGAPS